MAVLLLWLTQSNVFGESAVAVDQRRSVEQTFLTFPEWYLVHSPAEFAIFINNHPANQFPFITHTKQLWSSYYAVTEEQIKNNYSANIGYHVMIMVIATSTTIEYLLRSAYENTLGRISWALSSKRLTAEDKYAAVAAQDYVDFIRKDPWYLFDFTSRLKKLWTATPLTGPDMIRKWERRYALTTEYLIKAAYAKLIEKATRTAYEPALMTTQVVATPIPKDIPPNLDIKLVKILPDNQAVLDLPRYFNFRIAAAELAKRNINLVDIAGNSTVILITLWANDAQQLLTPTRRILFSQPLATIPGQKRIGIVMPVKEVSPFLRYAQENHIQVEHIYDY